MIVLSSENQTQNDIAQAFNDVLIFLKNQKLENLILCNDHPATTNEHCLFVFEWVCQGFLHRYLNIAKSFSILVNKQDCLPAAIIGRSLVETIAHFHNFLEKIDTHINQRNFDQVYHYIASYLIGGKHGFKPELKLKPLHINSSLELIEKTYNGITSSHDYLCEFVHPNALGTAVGFSHIDKPNHCVTFHDTIPFARGSSPVMEAALFAPIFQVDWKSAPRIRERIALEWKADASVCKLFEGEQ